MEKALDNVERLLGKDGAEFWRSRFERAAQMLGANRKFKRIADAPDKETLFDYLAEILYALVFVGLGFQVEMEPFGKMGPDFYISRDGQEAVVEVKRLRKVYPGPPEFLPSGKTPLLMPYGNLSRDTRKAFEKIGEKFMQVGDCESIIAIWNDDEDLEEIEVDQAVRDLRNDATEHRLSLPLGLSFILYGSKWIGDKQLYCFPLREPGQPHQSRWRTELEGAFVGDLVNRALSQQT